MTRGEKGQQEETVSLTIPSHPRFLYVVRSAMHALVVEAGFSKKEARRIVLALDEACSNIIKHAYEGDASGTIALTTRLTPDALLLELKDTGKKVNVLKIAPRELSDVRPGGLGTHFMNTVFDSVRYDTSGSEGTLLVLTKKRSP